MNTITPTYPCELGEADVLRLLPHRGGIRFARSVQLLSGVHFRGSVSWAQDAMGLAGHFPGRPIVPGIYLIEAAAQLAGAAMLHVQDVENPDAPPRLGMLAGTRGCLMRRPVLPGQRVDFELKARSLGAGMVQVSATAQVGNVLVATLELLVAQADAAQLPLPDASPAARREPAVAELPELAAA